MNCPVCNSQERIDYHTVKDFKSFQCQSCNHIYVDIGDFDFTTLYEEDFYTNYMSGIGYHNAFQTHLKNDFQNKVDLIKSLIPANSRVLEIGSGPGYFATMLKEYGYDVVPVELTQGAEDYAASHGLDIEILCEDISQPECSIYDEQFDLVISWAVIEHVVNPDDYINLMKRYCKNDGHIIIDTGVLHKPLALIDTGYSSWLFPPYHLHVFSKQSLYNLMRKHFSVKAYFPYWNIDYANERVSKIAIFYLKKLIVSIMNFKKVLFKRNEGKFNAIGLIIGQNNK